MSFRSTIPTAVRRRNFLMPAGYVKCQVAHCKRFARYPSTEDGTQGHCAVHAPQQQAIFELAKKKQRRTMRRGDSTGVVQPVHILAADTRRFDRKFDLDNVRSASTLCGFTLTEESALNSKWLSWHEGRYWLNAIVCSSTRPTALEGDVLAKKVRPPMVCRPCMVAYGKLVRKEHLDFPTRTFVLRITDVRDERVAYFYPNGIGVGQYVTRDGKTGLDLTLACVFATLEDAQLAKARFEDTHAEIGVTVAIRRLVEDPQEDCSDLDPLQERLAWFGGAFWRSDGLFWHKRLREKFGIEFQLPHDTGEDT